MIDYSMYLCTDSNINKKFTIEECVEQAILGGVTVVQVREKNITDDDFISLSNRIKKITDMYNVPLIINDNIEVAIAVNSAGVHVGQNDISCLEARQKLGESKIVGVSVTTLEEAKKAIRDGASYLGVGAMYKTNTKIDAKTVDEEDFNKILNYSNIPVVVIGGINEKTIPDFKGKKVSGYAMISAILDNDDIINASKELKKIINQNKTKNQSF